MPKSETRFEIVVDGTDGAGKTPCVQRIVEKLRLRAHVVATHAPYREQEVFPLWDTDPRRAARTIVDIMDRFRAASTAEVIVWDRGWPTAFISTGDVQARASFEPLPALTLLLLNTLERTRELARNHPDAGAWATDESLVRRYGAAYHSLEAPAGHRMLRFHPDPSSMFDLDAIWETVESVLDRWGRG